MIYILKNYSKSVSIVSGMLSGLVYAPTYFTFLWINITVLTLLIHFSKTYKEAFILGFLFGFGHFLTSIYWVSFAINVYAEAFWWFIPIALLGLPLILAFFIGFSSSIARFGKDSIFFPIVFAVTWIIFEYVRSFIFTGFPWNLAGYSLSFSLTLIQIASKISIYGISFIIIYIFSGFAFYFIGKKQDFKIHVFLSFIIIIIQVCFGAYRIEHYPTKFTNHKVRIVQASIKQEDKWDEEKLINNLNKHIELSEINNGFNPDIILWPESAIPFLINLKPVRQSVSDFLSYGQILVSGSILQDGNRSFVSLTGINQYSDLIFSYQKKHLVPFGEYIPLKKFIPMKKITNGFQDFSSGDTPHIISWKDLKIRPLICYEVIFPDEIMADNKNSDLLINITNDAWYGNIGPYQHLDIAKMRSIETGLPMIRAANNGISAVIDSVGRIVNKTNLNEITFIDSYMPNKLKIAIHSNSSKYITLLLIIVSIIVFIFINKKFIILLNN
jgi:apolipoprotein N-acyltransferase